jgi:GTPase SAR1 family protein
LPELKKLSISDNPLAEIPAELWQKTDWEELDLGGLKLVSLPPEIGELKSLTWLELSGNHLTSLPLEMTTLQNLERINLWGNPLQIAIPAKWLGDESGSYYAQDILAHYRRMYAEGGRELGEARILVVGEADAGKTKLLRALLKGEYGAKFIETRDPTEGIEVNTLEEKDLILRFWDFGGQEILHATHRFFLSRRCIYLLVADSTRDREYNESKIEYWLELIKFYGGASPVLLVASKTENFSLNVNERRLQEKYPNLVRMPALQTSAKTGRGISDLRRALIEQAQSLPSVSVMLPRSFLAVKNALEDLKAREKVKVIEDADYRRLCQENGITEQERQDTLLGLLHDMGVVLHYEDDRLSDFGILNPDWATGGVYKVVNNPQVKEAHGKFTLSQLKGLLDDEELYPAPMRRRIVDLMKNFKLIYELPLAPDTYILPSALPVNQPELAGWDVPAMTFEYRYPVLQVSVLHRFMVITHESILDEQIWYSGVVLAQGENQALVKADFRDRRITIKVKGAEETRKEFLYYLRTHFEHIHGEETQPEEYIYPPQYPDLPLPFAEMKIRAKTRREYEAFYQGRLITIDLRELLDGYVTPAERRRDEEREQKELERMGKERPNVTINVQGDWKSGITNIGDDNRISQTVQDSFNTNELRDTLEQLTQAVNAMLPHLSAEEAENAKDDLQHLKDELQKPKPNKKWYSVSIEGLIQAARNLDELGKPVISLAGKILELLNPLS